MSSKVLTELPVAQLTGTKGLVVFFYPKAGSTGCSLQVAGFNRKLDEFKKLGYNVVGISVDPVKANEEFINEFHLNFDLISDLDHKLVDEFKVWGVRDPDNNPHEGIIRSSFVLDPTGKVIIEHRGVSDINPVKDINDLLNELSA